MRKLLFLAVSHMGFLAVGFALGIYALPILIAPPSPDVAKLEEMASNSKFSATFTKDLRGSDFLHWGEGSVSLTSRQVIHQGELAPGPDYKLYLLKEFVEHEDQFLPLKSSAKAIGDIKTFKGFIVDVPEDVDLAEYNTVVVWCETFSEFITAAKYR